MRSTKVWLPLVALAAALTVGAAAAVAPSHTSPVTATLGVNRVAMQERTCTGDDGQYRQANETYAGSLAGDPRLTGVAVLYMNSVTNMTTGNGTAQGVLVVTNPQTQQVMLRAVFTSVLTGSGGLNMNGLLTGLVSDFGSQQGGRLVANFVGVQAGGSIYAGLGFNGPSPRPAVIQRGGCGAGATDRGHD